jgi:hypothetical protein
MKLRLQFNSIRLRLKRGEVEQLAKSGLVEEKIIVGAGLQDVFRYVLESSDATPVPEARLQDKGLFVQVPVETVLRWATGDDVGIETFLLVGNEERLQILIEKDFACLNGTDEQNADTFPHPLAGEKC